MSIATALSEIEDKALHLNQYLCDNASNLDVCRHEYVTSGIIHNIRWLSPEMEDAIRQTGMDLPAILDEWDSTTHAQAVAYIEGVLLGLAFARLGYREAKQETTNDHE